MMETVGNLRCAAMTAWFRLQLAYHALCGHGILCGADFRNGDLDLTRHRHWILRDGAIENNRILVSGPLFLGKRVTAFGNYGPAVVPDEPPAA